MKIKIVLTLLLLCGFAGAQHTFCAADQPCNYSGNNSHNGTETFNGAETHSGAATHNGAETFSNLKCKGNGCYDVTAYGADPTGVADSTAAVQAAITAAGNGGEVRFPPGTYSICTSTITITGSQWIHGLAAPGWASGGTAGAAATVFSCPVTGAVAFHIVHPSGDTNVQGNGPILENFMVLDTTNSGAGGLATGAIWVDTTNRYKLRGISVSNFTGTNSYGIKLDMSTLNGQLDSSYGLIEQPFLRGNYYGIWDRAYSNGTVVLGGQITNNTIGYYPDPAQTEHNIVVLGTSFEMATNNQIGVQLNGRRATIQARFEGTIGVTGVRGVQVTSTGTNNIIRPLNCAKVDVCVEMLSGSANNEVDVAGAIVGDTTIKNAVADMGTGNIVREPGLGEVWGGNQGGGLKSNVGSWFGRSVSGTNQFYNLIGRNGLNLRNSPISWQQVGSGALSRDGTGNLTITFTQTFSTAVGVNLVIDSASDTTYNTNACPVTTVTDSTHVICTEAGAAGTASYAYVYNAPGAGIGSPDGQAAVFGYGLDLPNNNSSVTPNSTGAAWMVQDQNGLTSFYGATGLTPGTAFTRTRQFQIGPTGINTSVNMTLGGTLLVPASAGGVAIGSSTAPFSGVQIGTSSTNRVNMTASTTAARAITWGDLGGTPTINVSAGTATMGTGAITAGTCATAVTVVSANVLATDSIAWSFNAAPGTGWPGLTVKPYATAGNVNFLICNPSAGSLTPAAATLNWKVTR